jgi:hypothetical protein
VRLYRAMVLVSLVAIVLTVAANVWSLLRGANPSGRTAPLLSLGGLVVSGFVTIITLVKQNERAQETLAFQRRNDELHEQLLTQSLETESKITGGNSYVWFRLLGAEGVWTLWMQHEGDYPLYDVDVQIQDDEQRAEMARLARGLEDGTTSLLRMEAASEWRQIYKGNVMAHTVLRSIGGLEFRLDGVEHTHLRFRILARNGYFVEELGRRWLADGTVVTAILVQQPVGLEMKLLKEDIDPKYPMLNGEPRWD